MFYIKKKKKYRSVTKDSLKNYIKRITSKQNELYNGTAFIETQYNRPFELYSKERCPKLPYLQKCNNFACAGGGGWGVGVVSKFQTAEEHFPNRFLQTDSWSITLFNITH